MKVTEIIEALRSKLTVPVGRHLYGVLGTYPALETFAKKLRQAKSPDGKSFPRPLNVNRGILEMIPDDEYHRLSEDEVIYPEPTVAHVTKAFERFLRSKLCGKGLVTLANLEMLFAYQIDLSPLRTMATDDDRILLLLPGRRMGDKIVMFPELDEGSCMLPTNLIAENHLWELRE